MSNDPLAGGRGSPPLYYIGGRWMHTSDANEEGLYLGFAAKHGPLSHYPVTDETAVFDVHRDEYEVLRAMPATPHLRTVAHATVKFRDQEYILTRDYGYGYPARTALFDWEENNCSCDHRRAAYFQEQHPGIMSDKEIVLAHSSCDNRFFPLVKFEIQFEA